MIIHDYRLTFVLCESIHKNMDNRTTEDIPKVENSNLFPCIVTKEIKLKCLTY